MSEPKANIRGSVKAAKARSDATVTLVAVYDILHWLCREEGRHLDDVGVYNIMAAAKTELKTRIRSERD